MFNVMCLTWNLELDLPNHAALEECFVNTITRMPRSRRPDVIVIGLQETMSYTRTGDGTFIGHKLADEKLLGGMDFLDDPYKLILTESFKGMTKKLQLFTRKAQQVVQVLVRKSWRDKLQVTPISKSRSWHSEKGFVGVDMAVLGKHLCFVSTHLDSGSERKRAADCEKISKELYEHAKHSKFHAMFMMGDLNFRLPPFKRGHDRDGYARLEVLDVAKYKPRPADHELLYEYMLNRKGRKQLMEIDTFHASHVFDDMPFVWPAFPLDSLPTYKRKHKDKHYKLIPKLKDAFEEGWLRKDVQDELLLKLYGGKGKFKWNKKRNCWDLGWLDRIGYAVRADGQYNEKLGLLKLDDMLRKGVTVHEPQGGLRLEVLAHVPYGDHAPVACFFTLAGVGEDLVVVDDEKVELEEVEDSGDELEDSDDELEDSDDGLFPKSPDSNFGIEKPKLDEPPSSFF